MKSAQTNITLPVDSSVDYNKLSKHTTSDLF